jgi:hypothetical protein
MRVLRSKAADYSVRRLSEIENNLGSTIGSER